MLIQKSTIDTSVTPVTADDTVENVRSRMKEEQVNTLPVIDQTTKKLVGQIHIKTLEDADSQNRISDIDLKDPVKLYIGQHIFEAARLMLQYELEMLPVVDKEWSFKGILTKNAVMDSLFRMLNLAEEGSVILVEVSRADFSLSEIVQIIETEGAKILGLTVETPDNKDQHFEVSLKLNLQDVSRVVAALRRYEYRVVTQTESTVFGEELEERADELLKFINM